jgi:signal transduction histidine kinase
MLLSLNRMKWVAIALPLAFVVFLRLTTDQMLETWPGNALFFIALAAGVVFFSTLVFGWLERSQRASAARTRELQALNELGRRLAGTLDRGTVIASVLEAAVGLLEADAAALQLEPPDGPPEVAVRGARAKDLERLIAGPHTGERGEVTITAIELDGGEAALLLSAPMPSGRCDALYVVNASPAAEPSDAAARLMYALATLAATALERCRLFAEVERREERTRALYDVGLQIASSQDLDRVLSLVTTQARELVGGKAAGLCLMNEQSGRLCLAHTTGEPRPAIARATAQFGGEGPLLHFGDAPAPRCPALHDSEHAVRSPLVVGSSVVGELCLIDEEEERFSSEDRALLASLADLAAIAIHNARLAERERQVAVLEERDHLAREIHDTLAQVLGYLHLKSATTRKHMEEGDVARASDELQEMQDLAHEAYVDVREAILGLRETVAPAGGIVGSLRQYLQKFGRQSGIEARLLAPAGVRAALAPDAEIQLLRVVQEALTNVRKHAAATRATVRLEEDGAALCIAVEDNGRGFDAARIERDEGRRFGLQSMRERVEGAGGQFKVESAPGAGTRIVVLLPTQK